MKLLSSADMIRLLSRSRSSLYRDVERGRLPQPFRIGGRCYWDTLEVESAISRLRAEGREKSADAST